MTEAQLIYDTPEKNCDLYYATKFRAPDPFIFLEVRGRKTLVMNDLEIDRAKRQAKVNEVLSLNEFMDKAKAKHKKPSAADILVEILRHKRIRTLRMPASTSFALVDELRKKGIKVHSGEAPFYASRLIKTPDELRMITQSQRAVFGAMRMVEQTIRASRVKRGTLYFRGNILTSNRMRTLINLYLIERGFVASDTIVSCGLHSIDPHDEGSGPLKANSAIIVDIYPRSMKTLYYGDATRTFCKGRAPESLRRLYATVKKGQELGIKSIRAGINGHKVHKDILAFFEKEGFPTGEKDGRMQGFFHSTGHGIGLELHEGPTRVGPVDLKLRAGNVLSVEPGLYYKGIGGVRIEDLVYVTKRGCKVISGYPKKLEIR